MHMHPEEIKAKIRLNKSSLAQIAESQDVSPSTVTQVLWGHSNSQRIRKAIARAAKIPLAQVPKKVKRVNRTKVGS